MPRPNSAKARSGTPRRRCSGGSTSGASRSTATIPATGTDDTWEAPEYLGCLGLRAKGGLVLTMAQRLLLLRSRRPAPSTPIVDPEARPADTRFNDGKPDRQGRFWSGIDVRGAGQAGRVRRLALPARPRPLGPPDDRGRRLLQRARLEPGQPDHVLLRQPHRPSSGPTISTRRPATSRTGAPSST